MNFFFHVNLNKCSNCNLIVLIVTHTQVRKAKWFATEKYGSENFNL